MKPQREEELKDINTDDQIILTNGENTPIALMRVEDIYDYDKKVYAEMTYGTLDKDHPGVNSIFNYKEKLMGGQIFLINEPKPKFPEIDLKPIETRVLFKEKKWERIVAFQTRNPPHLGHLTLTHSSTCTKGDSPVPVGS